VTRVGSKSFIEVEKMTREVRWWIRTSATPAGGRRDERENTARGSNDERNRRDETLAKPSAKEDWQGMVGPDPAFYLKDNGQRKKV
jgi:hypothetical protein